MFQRRYPLGKMCSVVVGIWIAHDDKEFPVEPRSLSDSEFDRLSDCLGRFGGNRSMNLEGLDGFLAALVCGPEEVPRSEYLPEIWADNIGNENAFLAQPLLRECVALITRHRDFTGSEVAERVLSDWDNEVGRFRKVMPTDYKRVLAQRAAASDVQAGELVQGR